MGMLLSNEASMSAVDTISREVSTGPFLPLAVYFKHAPRGDVCVYEDHFSCPVYFESGRDALLVSEQSISVSNRAGIEGVRVNRDFRGSGVGQKFFSWAINRARERGCHLVQLTTDKRRPSAREFYEPLGFISSHEGMKLKLRDSFFAASIDLPVGDQRSNPATSN
jgi:GNAT superfamily N-acetyltransferase